MDLQGGILIVLYWISNFNIEFMFNNKLQAYLSLSYSKKTFVSREILENTIALKHQKLSGPEQHNLTALLVAKDNELKETLSIAAEQAKINQKMDLLKAEVDQQDQDIQLLQRHLKEAEQILVNL